MEFLNYLANNIPLFSICAVMLFIAFRNLRLRKKESIYFIVFTTILVFLSVIIEMEKFSQRNGYVALGTVFTALGYMFRPALLYIFILLANMDYKRTKSFYLALFIPLIIVSVIYLLPVIFMNVPNFKGLVFYYQYHTDPTVHATFERGTFLNFASHAVSLFYLVVLVYVSTMRFHGKHRRDGVVLIICVAIIFITVLTEVLASRSDLLNIVCGICMMINYIFILSVNSSRDPLTNLYDRRTYYEDTSRYKNLVNGIIQIDMNGLKYVNDNYGHNSGDQALLVISNTLEDNVNKGEMCAYRLSGDEFLILMYQGKKEELEKTVAAIKEGMKNTNYSVAIGSYFIEKGEDISFEDAMKKAEERMYEDKADFYQITGFDRRKQ